MEISPFSLWLFHWWFCFFSSPKCDDMYRLKEKNIRVRNIGTRIYIFCLLQSYFFCSLSLRFCVLTIFLLSFSWYILMFSLVLFLLCKCGLKLCAQVLEIRTIIHDVILVKTFLCFFSFEVGICNLCLYNEQVYSEGTELQD